MVNTVCFGVDFRIKIIIMNMTIRVQILYEVILFYFGYGGHLKKFNG